MNPSLIISIIAGVISAIAIYVSIWTHNRNHKLQGRIVALEEAREKDRLAEKQKAYLTAKIEIEKPSLSGTSRMYSKSYLLVENEGAAEARNIQLILDNKPV